MLIMYFHVVFTCNHVICVLFFLNFFTCISHGCLVFFTCIMTSFVIFVPNISHEFHTVFACEKENPVSHDFRMKFSRVFSHIPHGSSCENLCDAFRILFSSISHISSQYIVIADHWTISNARFPVIQLFQVQESLKYEPACLSLH